MPFFAPLPEPEPEPEPKRPRRRRRRDDGWSRPTLEAPGYVADAIVVAETTKVAVVVHGIAAYRAGFALCLDAALRFEPARDADDDGLCDPFGGWGRRAAEARFGIAYADGSRAEFGDEHWLRDIQQGEVLAISPVGGGGGGGSWRYDMWVRPLPPPGLVTFGVSWPEQGIDEATVTIEGQRILDAALLARPLFPS